MRKSSIMVSIGIALFISTSVLSGCSDSKKTENVEKKAVFYKIKKDHNAVIKPPVTNLPAQMKKKIEGKPILSQKETVPPQAIAIVEKKGGNIKPAGQTPPEAEFSAQPVSKTGLKVISNIAGIVEEKIEKKNPEKRNPLEDLKKAALEKNETVTKEETLKEPGFWLYSATDEDTLWDIAKKYYGEGAYYPVLLEHNPHVGLYTVGTGVTLNILKNGENAAGIYKKIIIRKDGHFFWRYCVVSGDTLQSIVKKYYKKGRAKSDIPNLDKSTELKPGEKIWILIE
jgi:hypothetical protein